VDRTRHAGGISHDGATARILEGGRIFAVLALVGAAMTCWGAVRRWVFVLFVSPSGIHRVLWLRPITGPNPALARQALAAGIIVCICGIAFVTLRRDTLRIASMGLLLLVASWIVVVFHELQIVDPIAFVPQALREGLPLCGTAPCLEVIPIVEWIEWGAWVTIFWGGLAMVRSLTAMTSEGERPRGRIATMTDARLLAWIVGIFLLTAMVLYVGFGILYAMFAGDPA
jgi:hypothetical protein